MLRADNIAEVLDQAGNFVLADVPGSSPFRHRRRLDTEVPCQLIRADILLGHRLHKGSGKFWTTKHRLTCPDDRLSGNA